jgi:surfactin synthase thioesterase subunit
LASELPPLPGADQDFTCAQLEWRDLQSGSQETVAGAVERAQRLVRGFGDRRMVFYGHCLGAIVAYELAVRLAREGLAGPEHLITAGAVGPHLYVAPDAHRLPTPKLRELLRVLKFPHCERLEGDATFQAERLAMLRRDFGAMASYEHQPSEPLDIPITAVSLRHDLWSYPLRTGSWQAHTKLRCDVVERPGDHFVPLREPAVLSEILRSLGARSVAAE